MQYKTVCVFLAVLFPAVAMSQGAASYQCTFENLQRRIQVLSEPGVSVPCEVHYYKDSEMPGNKQVLWTATTEAGYCERKTDEFVAQLREWGWQCDAVMPDAAPVEEATDEAADTAADDTEALEPATE